MAYVGPGIAKDWLVLWIYSASDERAARQSHIPIRLAP